MNTFTAHLKLFTILLFFILGSLNINGQCSGELPEPLRVVNVSTSTELTTALSSAVAGDCIVLADGTYTGNFTQSISGTQTNPVIVMAANKLQAIFTGTWTLTGNDTWLWGLDFDGQNGTGLHVTMQGQRARLQRCRFHRFNTPGDAVGVSTSGQIIISVQGTGQKIYYCEFTQIDGRCISGKTNGSTPMRQPHIYRCYFHDYIKALGNANAREAIQFGQTQSPDGAPVQITIGALLEETLIQTWNVGGDDENEAVSIKSCGNTVKGCTFLDINLMNIRFGNSNRVESCWFEKVTSNETMGVGVCGDDNIVIRSKFLNGAYVIVNAGNQTMQQGPQVGYPGAWDDNVDNPLARRTRLIANEGALRIGSKYSVDTSPCENTSVEAHVSGTIYVQNDYPGTWDEVLTSLLETGTTYSTTTTETLPAPPFKLTAADVGTNANCTTTAIEENQTESNFSIYPNPTKGIFTINYCGEGKKIKLSVIDITGRTIHSNEYINNGTGLIEQVDLQEFPNGIYIAKIENKNEVKTMKLVKKD